MDKRRLIIIGAIGAAVLLIIFAAVYLYQANKESKMLEKEYNTRLAMEEYMEGFAAKNPLIQYLPYEEVDFEVHFGMRNEERQEAFYLIVVKMENPPLGVDVFNAAYSNIVSRAYEWIRGKGIDPDRLDMEIELEIPGSE